MYRSINKERNYTDSGSKRVRVCEIERISDQNRFSFVLNLCRQLLFLVSDCATDLIVQVMVCNMNCTRDLNHDWFDLWSSVLHSWFKSWLIWFKYLCWLICDQVLTPKINVGMPIIQLFRRPQIHEIRKEIKEKEKKQQSGTKHTLARIRSLVSCYTKDNESWHARRWSFHCHFEFLW